jgi:hypothetical protein
VVAAGTLAAASEEIAKEPFVPLEFEGVGTVAELLSRGLKKYARWGLDEGQVKLFLCPSERAKAVQKGTDPAADLLEDDLELFAPDSLEQAGVVPGSFVLALVLGSARGDRAFSASDDESSLRMVASSVQQRQQQQQQQSAVGAGLWGGSAPGVMHFTPYPQTTFSPPPSYWGEK